MPCRVIVAVWVKGLGWIEITASFRGIMIPVPMGTVSGVMESTIVQPQASVTVTV